MVAVDTTRRPQMSCPLSRGDLMATYRTPRTEALLGTTVGLWVVDMADDRIFPGDQDRGAAEAAWALAARVAAAVQARGGGGQGDMEAGAAAAGCYRPL